MNSPAENAGGTPPALAVLFADISGSTKLYETLGDQEAKARIAVCLESLVEIADTLRGTLVKTIGDEIMCHFPDPVHAVEAAIVMQKSLQVSEGGEHTGVPMQIRIGLHYGPVIREQGDVFGDAVNVAARMAAIARAGQIITTRHTVVKLPSHLQAQCRLFDKVKVKGKQAVLSIYQVLWAPQEATHMVTTLHTGPSFTANTRLHLRYRDYETEMSAGSDALLVGRDINCGLVVAAKFTSRNHALVHYQRGKFVLLDQSTNGTMVRFQNGESVYLRREELPLWGKGVISLGEPIRDGDIDLIHFSCQ